MCGYRHKTYATLLAYHDHQYGPLEAEVSGIEVQSLESPKVAFRQMTTWTTICIRRRKS